MQFPVTEHHAILAHSNDRNCGKDKDHSRNRNTTNVIKSIRVCKMSIHTSANWKWHGAKIVREKCVHSNMNSVFLTLLSEPTVSVHLSCSFSTCYPKTLILISSVLLC